MSSFNPNQLPDPDDALGNGFHIYKAAAVVQRRRSMPPYVITIAFLLVSFIFFITGFQVGSSFQVNPTTDPVIRIVTVTPHQFDLDTVGICNARVKVASAQLYFLPLTRAVPSIALPLDTALTILGRQPDNWYEDILWVQIYQALPGQGIANLYWLRRTEIEFNEDDVDCENLPAGLLK